MLPILSVVKLFDKPASLDFAHQAFIEKLFGIGAFGFGLLAGNELEGGLDGSRRGVGDSVIKFIS
jgi:hypothetical protein